MSSRSTASSRPNHNGNNSRSSSGPTWNHTEGDKIAKCDCGIEIPIVTSWTNKNPGRRFRACPYYGTPSYCGVYDWVDPPMCERAKNIIPGLLRKINGFEAKVETVEREKKKLQEFMDTVEREKKKLEESVDTVEREKKKLEFALQTIQSEKKKLEVALDVSNKKLGVMVVIIVVLLVIIATLLPVHPKDSGRRARLELMG